MSSCFSRHLSKRDAKKLPELVSEMQTVYTPEPTNMTIYCMCDVKRWMEGYVELRQDLPKLSAKFDQATENWWDTFLGDLENGKSNGTIWFLKIAEDAPTPRLEITDEGQRVGNQIEKLMEKQMDETQVCAIGCQNIYTMPMHRN